MAFPVTETGPAAVRSPKAGRPRVSLCMMVQDEAANLPACLASAADLVDEMVVVDTGSADHSRAVAASWGAQVHDFAWQDSFAAARNEGLRLATGDWIFWLDADERLAADDRERLRALLGGLGADNVAYLMRQWSIPEAGSSALVVEQARLFRRHPQVRWTYRVHEQILPAVQRLGGRVCRTDVTIQHHGYQDPAVRRRKLERNLRLLDLEHGERPGDAFTLFHLGLTRLELGQVAAALVPLRRCLERAAPAAALAARAYALLAHGHRQLGQRDEALMACRQGRVSFPSDPELLFQEALLRYEAADLAGAEACLVQLLQAPAADCLVGRDAGVQGGKARHNLALVYRDQRRWPEAEAQWRAALAAQPAFLAAWLGLGELYLLQQRWAEVETAAQALEGWPAGRDMAAHLRGQVLRAPRSP